MITAQKFINATMEGFDKSMNGNIESLQTEIDQFCNLFLLEEIVPGNVYDIVYKPSDGTRVYSAGVEKAHIPGLAFK